MSDLSAVASQVRPGSAVRGAGVALACLTPSLAGRARVVGASYAASWPLGKPGIQLAMVVPDADAEPWKRAVYPLASSGASWTAAVLGLSALARRSRLPTPVAAALLGAVVAVGDTRLVRLGERVKAQRAAAASE